MYQNQKKSNLEINDKVIKKQSMNKQLKTMKLTMSHNQKNNIY